MTAFDEFEQLLKEVVQAKRLSASKMNKLTEIAMKSIEDDTQLVSILYRTHKTLPPASKVSSLYVFDALSRAARHHVVKHGITTTTSSDKGNAATFLLKVEGILDGLIQDMATIEGSEAKEKTKKILDIWLKGNTFPAPVLSRLKEVVKDAEQVSEHPSKPPDPRPAQPVPTPANNVTQTTPPQPPVPSLTDPQATLLALLTKAVSAAPAPIQTPQNNDPSGQLSILHQLAQTAKLSSESASHFPPQNNQFHTNQGPPPSFPDNNQGYHEPNRHNPRQWDHSNDRRPRGGHRGSFRGGGRGRGDGWKEDRGDRFKDRDWSPRQRRDSRSKSPTSRYAPAKRDVRPYSPPRRPSTIQSADGEKDEFGRDLRPASSSDEAAPGQSDVSSTVPSSSGLGSVDTAPAVASSNLDHQPVSTSIAANTSMSPPAPASTTITKDASTQLGLESFNIASFDFTSAASWESLGKMWQVTNGEMPSTEQLMQFVMSFGAPQQQQWGWAGETDAQQNSWDTQSRGGGHGYQGHRRRGGYSNGRDFQQQRHWNHNYDSGRQETEAIVLGGGSDYEQQADVEPDNQSTSGGSMQKVGDKWMFIRDPAVGVT